MIIHSYDVKTESFVKLKDFYEKNEYVTDTCLIVFSYKVYAYLLKTYVCKKISEIRACNGHIDIMLLEYKNKKIAFYLTQIGSTMCAQGMIEAAWLIGAHHFILAGSCGSLDEAKTKERYVIPTSAYRDEGMSYHYAPASDNIEIKNKKIVEDFFKENHIPYICGKTWTTDAFLRETKGLVQKRREEGCIVVEMEAAGVQATADFYGLDVYYFLESGDSFSEESYSVGNLKEANHHFNKVELQLELALKLKKEVTLFKPHIEDLWYRQKLVEDEKTMSFNDRNGGCFPFDHSKWQMFYLKWCMNQHYFYSYIRDEKCQFVGEASYVETNEENVCLAHMIIQYDERHKGYGTKGLTLLLNQARKNGMKKVIVQSTNEAFLVKNGFQKINEENCKYYRCL